MPQFHYRTADDSPADETAALGNYFAARDGRSSLPGDS